MSTSPKKQLLRIVVDLPPGEAVEAILAWVEEVIGPDEPAQVGMQLFLDNSTRNQVRAEQRQRLYGGGE